MRILIEIDHPAHVHYFRNLINILKSKGHEILILAMDRGLVQDLLKNYKFEYILFKSLPKNMLGKLLSIPETDLLFYKHTRKFKPDLLVGFSGTFISHAGWLTKRPGIVIDDTDAANLAHITYKYFAKVILTPTSFNKDFGKKQIRFDSYIEFAYLHPNYFQPDPDIFKHVKLDETKKIIIMRFISWRASHDVGQAGLPNEAKIELVKALSKYANIFISSEEPLPNELAEYKYPIATNLMHHALAKADLFIGEGATMVTESAILGTPAIYISSIEYGNTTEEEEKYGLVYNFRTPAGLIEKALSLIQDPGLKSIHIERKKKLLSDKIDITAFLTWFMDNYPDSVRIIKENPDYQYNFR